MDIDTEELAKSYAELADSELLKMHTSGELTDIAYNILETELTLRGISIPQHKDKPEVKRRPQSLRAHWKGQASLVSAYWLLWILGGALFYLSLLLLIKSQASQAIFVSVVFVWFAYIAFSGVSVWRCAWNSSWKGWGYLARVIVIIGVFNALNALVEFVPWIKNSIGYAGRMILGL